jgi:protocatechuate 4,5-dioxygenase beta chain
MDFMLMMGVAGAGQKADHVDTLDLFHTMEAYFTWYPNGVDLSGSGEATARTTTENDRRAAERRQS